MKKIYIMPAITVVKVQTAKLMSQSQILVEQGTVNGVHGDSRRGGAGWDDED